MEKLIVADASLDHEYLPIDGMPQFTEASTRLILGHDSPAIAEKRVQCHLASPALTGPA